MALNKKSLGPSILSLEKGASEEVQNMTLESFAQVVNSTDGTTMVAFTTEESDKYFWASTSLKNFLEDNFDAAEPVDDTGVLHFPEDKVYITHMGKTPLKNDKSKTANVWKITF